MSKAEKGEGKKFQDIQEKVVKEIGEVLGEVNEESLVKFIEMLGGAEKVLVIGVGRVMLMAQAFAKRLNHLKIAAFVVGETTTPPIEKDDLLIAASGSGETMTTVNVSRLAKEKGAKVALITATDKSTLGGIADIYVKIPCPTKLKLKGEHKSIQPMSNLFEQSLLIFFDCVSMMIQEQSGISEEDLWRLHANLE